MERVDPLSVFRGRDDEVAAFERLIAEGGRERVMLVDGLSGTGKSLLADWLRERHAAEVPCSWLLLSPSVNEESVFRRVASSLGSEFAKAYDEGIAKLVEQERGRTLVSVNHAPKAEISARLGGKIVDASQEANVSVDVGSFGEVLQKDRRIRRLDVLVEALASLRDKRWVLFIDETEHLENPELGQLILDDLVQRLRSSFDGLRFYLTGQSVPRSQRFFSFSRRERISCTLETFPPEVTRELFAEVGVSDPDIHEALYEITGGHPLLVGMSMEFIHGHGSSLVKRQLEDVRSDLSERARTDWLYDGILNRLPEEIQGVASNLALFDWFNLGLLRGIFGDVVSEAAFRDLERRSFIKRLPDGTLRCHDIVRDHLMPLRLERDPQASRALLEKAVEAYMSGLSDAVKQEGRFFIDRRIDYVSASFHAALHVEAEAAASLLLTEIGLALTESQDDYIFSTIRLLEDTQGLRAPLNTLGSRVRRCLERINASLVLDRENLKLLVELAEELESGELENAADWIWYKSTMWASEAGRHDLAKELAERALRNVDDLANRIIQARVHAAAGEMEPARELLAAAREAKGDSVELRLATGSIEAAAGNRAEALGIYLGIRREFPDGALRADVRVASMQIEDGAFEEALGTLERAEARDGETADTRALKAECFVRLGRFDELSALPLNSMMDPAEAVEMLSLHERIFADPAARGRFIAEFKLSPKDTPIVAVFGLGDFLGLRGDHETVQVLVDVGSKQWPEAQNVLQLKLAAALLHGGQIERAGELYKTLRKSCDLAEATMGFALYHQKKGEHERERELLAEARTRWPNLADVIDQGVAGSFLKEKRPEEAQRYLHGLDEAENLGPRGRRLLAVLDAKLGDTGAALEQLERLIYTEDRSDVSRVEMAQGRALHATLLLSEGREDDAKAAADAILDLFGELPGAGKQVLELYAKLKDLDGMRQLIERYGAESEIGIGAIGVLAQSVVADGPDVEELLRAIQEEPDRIELMLAMRIVLLTSGDDDAASATMDRMEALAPGAHSRLERFDSAARRLMQHAFDAGQFRDLMRSVDLSTADLTAATMITGAAEALCRSGRIPLSEAVEAIDQVGAAKSELAGACDVLVTKLALAKGDLEVAAERLDPHLEGPDLPPALLWEPIDEYLDARDDVDGRIAFIRRLADARPDARRVMLERLAAIQLHRDAGQALATLEELEAEGPLETHGLLTRSRALAESGQVEAAIDIARGIAQDVDLEVDPRSVAYLLWGRLEKERGDGAAAVAAFRASTEIDPEYATAWKRLALALRDEGDPEGAYQALLEAVSLDPGALAKFESQLMELRDLAAMETTPA